MAPHLWRRPMVRYNRELECFEMRCEDCERYANGRNQLGAYFHPLDLEFWDPHTTMRRCRACILEDKRRKERERKANLPHEAKLELARKYRAENRDVINIKRRERRRRRREEAA